MNTLKTSIYDLPNGYTNTLQISKKAIDLLSKGNFITVALDNSLHINPSALRANTLGMTEQEFNMKKAYELDENPENCNYFFPHLEMYDQGELTKETLFDIIEEIYFNKAHNALSEAQKQYADHITEPYFLAWGLQKKIFGDAELQSIKFDHGDQNGSYIGEQYVKSYGGDFDREQMKLLEDLLDPETFRKIPKQVSKNRIAIQRIIEESRKHEETQK